MLKYHFVFGEEEYQMPTCDVSANDSLMVTENSIVGIGTTGSRPFVLAYPCFHTAPSLGGILHIRYVDGLRLAKSRPAL